MLSSLSPVVGPRLVAGRWGVVLCVGACRPSACPWAGPPPPHNPNSRTRIKPCRCPPPIDSEPPSGHFLTPPQAVWASANVFTGFRKGGLRLFKAFRRPARSRHPEGSRWGGLGTAVPPPLTGECPPASQSGTVTLKQPNPLCCPCAVQTSKLQTPLYQAPRPWLQGGRRRRGRAWA